MGSIDWYEARRDWQTGPGSLAELYEWTSNAFSCLSEKKPESLVCLTDNIVRGGSLISHYSGKGTAESMLADISEYVCSRSPGLGTCQQPRFRCSSACDTSHTCRNLMLHQQEESRPRHVFGDILDRVPQQSPPLADLTNEQLREFLKSNGHRLFHTEAKAFCFRHLRPCRLWDGLDAPASAHTRSGLLVAVAGFSCTDFSPRRTGQRPGLLGKTAPAFHHWIGELRALQPDILLWENVPTFPAEVLRDLLGEEYVHHDVLVGPDMLGWPQSRERRFGLAVLRQTCHFAGSADEFLSLFRRKVAGELSADCFFQAPDEEVQDMMRQRACRRGLQIGPDQDVSLDMAITPGMKLMLQEYADIRPSRAGLNGAFVCDLDQNAGYAASGPFLPSCPTHASIYSFRLERLMTGHEMLAAMGGLTKPGRLS